MDKVSMFVYACFLVLDIGNMEENSENTVNG